MRRANFSVVKDTLDKLVLRDHGPWDQYLTVTNAAEDVVAEIAPKLGGRRLFYYDSEGELTELVVTDGRFGGFKAAHQGGTTP